MRNFYIIYIFILLIIGCKTTDKLAVNNKVNIPEKDYITFQQLFLDANKEKLINNYPQAEILFKEALKFYPQCDACYFELAKLSYNKSVIEDAMFYINKAIKLNGENDWYLLFQASLYMEKGNFKNAIANYNKYLEKNPKNIEYKYEIALAYIYDKDYSEAIKIYDDIEKTYGASDEIIIKKFQLYQIQKNTKEAINEIEKLIKLYPDTPEYYLYVIDIYLSSSDLDKALEIYDKVLKIDPSNADIHLKFADYYRAVNNIELFNYELQQAFKSKSLSIDNKIKILLSYFQITQNYPELKQEAYKLLDILIQVNGDDPKAMSMYADFLFRDNKYKEAKEYFEKILNITQSKYIIWHQLIYINYSLRQIDEMGLNTDKALELFPMQAELYLYKGIYLMEQNRYNDAIKVLEEGLKYSETKPDITSQIYIFLAENNYKNKDKEKCYSYFEKALEINPKNTYVLNNYSYYLALENENLEKALSLSKKSNEISPDFTSFQDTYAFVLYKLGKYDDAKVWAEKAIKNGGIESAEILEHYGDILSKLGDKENAIKIWNLSIEKGADKDIILKKINDISHNE